MFLTITVHDNLNSDLQYKFKKYIFKKSVLKFTERKLINVSLFVKRIKLSSRKHFPFFLTIMAYCHKLKTAYLPQQFRQFLDSLH